MAPVIRALLSSVKLPAPSPRKILVGPAGLISMEDGYAAEIVQQSVTGDRSAASFVEMGGTGVASEESLITETAIRGFWGYYRDAMGFQSGA